MKKGCHLGKDRVDVRTADPGGAAHGRVIDLNGLHKKSAGAPKPAVVGVGDEVDAEEELREAGAGDLVKDLQATLLADKESGFFHDCQVLGESRHVATCHFREIVHAMLTLHQGFHDQEARGMGHRLHDGGADRRIGFQFLKFWRFWRHLFGKYAK